MTVIVKELREALIDAGSRPDLADKAAEAVVPTGQAATREDLANVKADLVKWFAGIMIAHAVTVVLGTVGLMRLLP